MIKKRGLSNVVAAVMLILLTLAALALISAFIIPMVRKNLDEGSACLNYKDYFIFNDNFNYNCYVISPGERSYALSVEAASVNEETEEKVKGFNLVFIREGDSTTIKIEENAPATNEIRMIDSSLTSLKIPKSGETRTYVYKNENEFEIVEIHPVLKTGRICDKNDIARIKGMICENAIPT